MGLMTWIWGLEFGHRIVNKLKQHYIRFFIFNLEHLKTTYSKGLNGLFIAFSLFVPHPTIEDVHRKWENYGGIFLGAD